MPLEARPAQVRGCCCLADDGGTTPTSAEQELAIRVTVFQHPQERMDELIGEISGEIRCELEDASGWNGPAEP